MSRLQPHCKGHLCLSPGRLGPPSRGADLTSLSPAPGKLRLGQNKGVCPQLCPALCLAGEPGKEGGKRDPEDLGVRLQLTQSHRCLRLWKSHGTRSRSGPPATPTLWASPAGCLLPLPVSLPALPTGCPPPATTGRTMPPSFVPPREPQGGFWRFSHLCNDQSKGVNEAKPPSALTLLWEL